MPKLGDQVQSADWKQEKHSPVIECPDSVKAGEKFQVTVSVGKEIAHPNTSVKGANEGPAFTEPAVRATLTLKTSGTLYGLSFCNIHGLWESSKAVKVG